MKIFTLISILAGFWVSSLFSQVLEDFDESLNINNYGKQFFLSVPPSFQDENINEPNFVRVFIGSIKTALVVVEVPDKAFKRTVTVSPGGINEVTIPTEVAQPYIKPPSLPSQKSKVYENASIRISSDEDIFVYVVANNKSSNGGYLAYPSVALSTKYQISSFGDGSHMYPLYHSLPSITTIVGNYDNTVVSFVLGGNNVTISSDGNMPYHKTSQVINEGDVWVISTQGNFSDLSGSVVEASYPVSVIAGNQSANVPIDNKWSDYIVEMMTPVESWGKTYHGFKIINKKFNPVYRVYAKYDNTVVYLNGEVYDTIHTAGGIEKQGYLSFRTNSDAGEPDIISSDKPIGVNLYNTGAEEDAIPGLAGGPFQIGLVSQEQFAYESLIAMPGTDVPDGGYDELYMVIITKGNSNNIEIGELSINNTIWKNINDFNIIEEKTYQYDGSGYYLLKMPKSGIYRLKGDEPFCTYIYGFENSTGFGFAGSNTLKFLNDDNIPPVPEWVQECTGDVEGIVTDMPADNPSNLANAIFDRTNSYNYEFLIEQIIPGVTNQAQWSLRVKNPDNNAKAVISFRDKANNDTTITITYKAPGIELIPKYHNFGSFSINDDITEKNFKEFTLRNISDTVFFVERLELLSADKGFSFKDEFTPNYLEPGEIIKFTVFFNPINDGRCTDSILIGNECYFGSRGFVEAEVGIPLIEVSDARFDNIRIDDVHYREIYIKNIGKTDLLLKDAEGTFSTHFQIAGEIDFSPTNPHILKPKETYKFTVRFSASADGNYRDSVVILSNAEQRIDNVALLNASVIPPGLKAGSYSWERRRINRAEYPAGPFPIENEYNGILIENTGDEDLIITGFNIEDDINGSAFEFNRGLLNNLSIKANSNFILPVKFRPGAIGNHKLVIVYNDNKGGKARTTLSGIGVAPKIQVEDVNFDTCIVDNYTSYKRMNIVIKNLGFDEWNYADTLNLSSLKYDENISDNWEIFNNKKFKIDYPASLPITILPGNTAVIRAAYVPTEYGYDEAWINTFSDALEDTEFKMSGFGIYHNIHVTGGTVITCLNMPTLLKATVSNKSTNSITIKNISLKDNNKGFSLSNDYENNPFLLPPDATETIELYFNPMNKINYSNELIVTTDSEPAITRKAEITGLVSFAERNIITTPTSKIGKIGEKTMVSLLLEDGEDISEYGIDRFEAIISYNTSMLSINKEDIELGERFKGKFEITDKLINDDKGEITLRFKSLMNNVMKEHGNIVNLYFYVYYPLDSSDKSIIDVQFTSNRDECVYFKTHSAKIDLQPVCIDDLRRINVSDYDYNLNKIAPNPISDNQTEITFSIAFDGQTTLELFSSGGEKILVLADKIMQAGNYSFSLDLKDIPSGIYWYKLQSGPYTKAHPLVISK